MIGERVAIYPAATWVRSGAVNLAGKVTSIIAGMAAGADSIDDLDMDPVRRDGPVGHSKVGHRQVLRRGLSPLATTLSTAQGVPVIAGIRLRWDAPARPKARRRW